MEIHLAALATDERIFKKQDVKLHLAGSFWTENNQYPVNPSELQILESYYYLRSKEWIWPLLSQFNSFMLDSGAFTFMNNVKGAVDWDEYIKEYAEFINKWDIDLFFELDIDSIVGIEEVERLREKLEDLTGKPSIPVWHVSRGYDYWLKMIDEYDYIAIGGIVTGEITRKQYPVFRKMLMDAHKKGVKVHGLGFTNLKGLELYPFDSVDSTSWLSGNRFGAIYKFNGRTMEKYDRPEGTRVKTEETAVNNFIEWHKFCMYARDNL